MLTVARNVYVEIQGTTFIFRPLSALEVMRIAAAMTSDPVGNIAYVNQILCEKMTGLKNLVDENGKPYDVSTVEGREELLSCLTTPILMEIWARFQESAYPSEDEKKS